MLGEEPQEELVREHIESLRKQYESDNYAFSIASIAGGYQFLTKPAYEKTVNILLNQTSRRRLSRSALETLAIIAYRQPVTKTQVELLRGVGADYAIHKLLEKELITVKGRAKTAGRPVLYGTSDKFMQYFGINGIEDLPLPEDFEPAAQASNHHLAAESDDED
jgi:segregation and condensation protein B